MPILTVAALAIAVLGGQEARADAVTPTAERSRPASTTPINTLASRQPPPAGTPTRTVCSLERATGSTMSRRVCREVPVNSSQRDQSTNDRIRQIQGARFSDRPNGM